MTGDEAQRLIDVIAAAAPAQKFDDASAGVWAAVMDDVRIGDALAAVKAIIRRRPFVGISDIVTEVARIRAERLAAARIEDMPPNVDPSDVEGYARELAAMREAAMDGELDVAAYRHGGVTLTAIEPFRPAGVPLERPRRLAIEARHG